MPDHNELKEKMLSAPRGPGVYLMLDLHGKVIYVGKANDLKNRISQYFTGKDARPMAPFLMARVSQIEFITTATQKEALILENNLIKKHRPRYNVILRDDKTYYHLSLDPAEKFPRLQLVRKRGRREALYFGPYPSGLAARETLRFVQKVFPLRTCRDRDFHLKTRPCLEYQIGRCLAPCQGLIDEDAYRKLAENAVSFLMGRRRELVSDLKRQMHQASDDLHFEEAARLRDRIAALEHALEKQHVDGGDDSDQDVLGVYQEADTWQLCVLFVRAGKLLGSRSFAPVRTKADAGEVVSSALRQYEDASGIPDEIILPVFPSDEEITAEWLADKKGKKVSLTVPVRGSKKALLEMACANARELYAAFAGKEEQRTATLETLRRKLGLSRLPQRMECYDISNISGKSPVGSMVVFTHGEPDKPAYRKFRIRAPERPDDYGMMRELLSRRFKGREPLPDLMVVDGGKGQLNVAVSVLNELGIKADVISLAEEESPFMAARQKIKGKTLKTEDRVYLPRRKDAVYLSSSPAALALLQRLRDEAHRFAVTYHRRLRTKKELSSVLEGIADIGPARRRLLLKHFGSVARVKKATVEDLQKVPGIGQALAARIFQELSRR
jgi:excinuclease ABC subunit C